MTSLVDVTLVLLIIFIISAPFMRAGVRVDLPKAAARQPHPQRAILITIDRTSQIFVNEDRVRAEDVAPRVMQLRREAPGLPVLVEGDAAVPYGRVVAVMDAVRRAGIENIGLVLEAAAKP